MLLPWLAVVLGSGTSLCNGSNGSRSILWFLRGIRFQDWALSGLSRVCGLWGEVAGRSLVARGWHGDTRLLVLRLPAMSGCERGKQGGLKKGKM